MRRIYRSYIQRECRSVLAKLHPITFYRIISGECAVPGLNVTFCFLWFAGCVLLFDKNLILGCLWPLVFVLNNILILGIWCSTIPHLPGCFCPWTFFENSRNKRRNLWVGRCVSSWWPWFPSRSSVLIYMYVYIYICTFLIRVLL